MIVGDFFFVLVIFVLFLDVCVLVFFLLVFFTDGNGVNKGLDVV